MLTEIVNLRTQPVLRAEATPLIPHAPGIPGLDIGDSGEADYEEEDDDESPWEGTPDWCDFNARFRGHARLRLEDDLAEGWSRLVRPHLWIGRFLSAFLEEAQGADAGAEHRKARPAGPGRPCRSSSTTLSATRHGLTWRPPLLSPHGGAWRRRCRSRREAVSLSLAQISARPCVVEN